MEGLQANGYVCESGVDQTSHGFFCKERFPYPRGQLQNVFVGMCLNALQDINQIDRWIDFMDAATGQQDLDRCQSLRVQFGPAKSSQPGGVSPPGCSQNRT